MRVEIYGKSIEGGREREREQGWDLYACIENEITLLCFVRGLKERRRGGRGGRGERRGGRRGGRSREDGKRFREGNRTTFIDPAVGRCRLGVPDTLDGPTVLDDTAGHGGSLRSV